MKAAVFHKPDVMAVEAVTITVAVVAVTRRVTRMVTKTMWKRVVTTMTTGEGDLMILGRGWKKRKNVMVVNLTSVSSRCNQPTEWGRDRVIEK